MTTRLAKVTAQIEKLQREAERLKAKEVAGVIARIKEAIDYYDLTAEDLGLSGRRRQSAASARKNGRKPSKRAVKRGSTGVIKYRDEHGNTWTGRGRAPGWFKAALEAGVSKESLAV